MREKPWLSIILPSINTHAEFINSLYKNSAEDYINDIEFQVDSEPGGSVKAIERAISKAKADWIWIANDDLICETPFWDKIFYESVRMFDDGVAMFFPNDNIFGHTFPCFPLVRKDMIKRLFPSPFEKYKIDDSIRDVIPRDRRFYLGHVTMRHNKIIEGKYDYDVIAMKNDYIKYISDEQMALRDDILRENMNKTYHNIDRFAIPGGY